MFLEHPILGIGLGTYPNVYFEYKETSTWHLHSHNIFVQYASETGIIGLLSLIWLLVALFKEGFRKKIENSYEKAVKEGSLASLIGFLIHNQVDYLLWLPLFQLYFWLIFGILSAIQAKKYMLSNTWRFISIIIILFWTFCVIIPFLGYVYFNQGVELANKGKWESAKIKFEKAVLFDFYHPIYHAHLSKTYTKIYPQNLTLSIKEYKTAHQLDIYSPLFYRGVKYVSIKNKDSFCWKLYRRIPMLEF
jgi:tetratricopeptide (TPR) repeat protein